MEPSFLKRHLSGCYPDLKDKDIDFFKHKEVGVKRIRLDQRAIQSTDSSRSSCLLHGGFAHRSGKETTYDCRKSYTPLLPRHHALHFGR